MPWWWTSSPTITLLPGASMPPMLHHHHVSPSDRCCYLMPPTFKKKNRSCISLSLWHSLFKNPLLPFLFFGQGLSKYINKLKNKETRRNTFFISKCSGSVKVFFLCYPSQAFAVSFLLQPAGVLSTWTEELSTALAILSHIRSTPNVSGRFSAPLATVSSCPSCKCIGRGYYSAL